MKSFCIKTNNKNIIDYLLDNFSFPNTYISVKKFKVYKNIIIHFVGETNSKEENSFYNYLSNILVNIIINFYEYKLFKFIITSNYFYFSEKEQKLILKKCIDHVSNKNTTEHEVRIEHIYIAALKYISNNKSMILDGFVNFRISNYMKILDYVVDTSVNELVINREYNEFINLLKTYIKSKSINMGLVHLIYKRTNSFLLNSKYEKIPLSDNINDLNYISDVSFSENDIILNTLLSLLPQKIIIHLEKESDEFIKTLISIFEDRVQIK